MRDPRYGTGLNGLSSEELGRRMRAAMDKVATTLPDAAIAIFAFGEHGEFAYICNADRRLIAQAVREWADRVDPIQN